MNCRRPFSIAHLQSMTRAAFMNGPYRSFRERLLLARETALLPTSITLSRLLRAASELCRHRIELINTTHELPNWTAANFCAVNVAVWNLALNNVAHTLQLAERTQNDFRAAEHQLYGTTETAATTAAATATAAEATEATAAETATAEATAATATAATTTAATEAATKKRTVYTAPCPRSECAGFLNERHVCGICDARVCERCHSLLSSATDAALSSTETEHVCKAEDVASVALVRRETKACPRCSARVFKTGGCDQMFCTACNTSFSWRTLDIVTQGIHNPHYFEWLFRTGGRGDEEEHGLARAQTAQAARDDQEARRRLLQQQQQQQQQQPMTPTPAPREPLPCVNVAQDWRDIGRGTYDQSAPLIAVSAARDFFVGRFFARNPRNFDTLRINLTGIVRAEIEQQQRHGFLYERMHRGAADSHQQQTLRPHPLPADARPVTLLTRFLEELRLLDENIEILLKMNDCADLVEQSSRNVAAALGPHAAETFRRYRNDNRTRMHANDPRALNEDLRVLRLLGKLDNDQFQRELVLRETRRAREQERIQIAALYVDVCAQTVRNVTNFMILHPVWRPEQYLNHSSCSDICQAVARTPGRDTLLQRVAHMLRSLDELRTFVNARAQEASQRTQRATIRVALTGELEPRVQWRRTKQKGGDGDKDGDRDGDRAGAAGGDVTDGDGDDIDDKDDGDDDRDEGRKRRRRKRARARTLKALREIDRGEDEDADEDEDEDA